MGKSHRGTESTEIWLKEVGHPPGADDGRQTTDDGGRTTDDRGEEINHPLGAGEYPRHKYPRHRYPRHKFSRRVFWFFLGCVGRRSRRAGV